MFFWIALCVTTVLTVLLSAAGVPLLVVLFTFGIGFFFVIIPVNLLPLLASFIPSALLPPGLKPTGVVLAIVLYGAFLLGPGAVAYFQEKQLRVALAADTIAPQRPVAKGPFGFDLMYLKAPKSDPCPEACRALIKSGDAAWVRVHFGNEAPTTFAPDTSLGVDIGLIREVPNTDRVADYLLRETSIDDPDLPENTVRTPFINEPSVTRFEVTQPAKPSETPVFRKTVARYKVMGLTLFMPDLAENAKGGYEYAGHLVRLPSETHLSVLRSMGWAQEAVAPTPRWPSNFPLPTEQDRQALLALLESPNDSWDRKEQRTPISYFNGASGRLSMSSDELLLLARTIKDPRLHDHQPPLRVLLQHQEPLRKLILPWFFEELAKGGLQNEETQSAVIKSMIEHYKPRDLAPYYDQYLATKGASALTQAHLPWLVGRFDRDPMDTFRKMIAESTNSFKTARDGVCFADLKYQPTMVSELIDVLKAHYEANYVEGDKANNRARLDYPLINDAVEIAAIFGYYDVVEALVRPGSVRKTAYWRKLKRSKGDYSLLRHSYDGPCEIPAGLV